MAVNTITLTDGRQLAYTTYGLESGSPVWYFHGTPSSRLEPLLLNAYGIDLEALLAKSGLLLIAVDRPGMGLSTYNDEGNFISFADDVSQLRNFLNIGTCPVLCWSGGGPYALALASRYPDAISGVFILCGFTRRFDKEVMQQMGGNKSYFNLAKNTPWILDPAMKLMNKMQVRTVPPRQLTGLADVDYSLINDLKHLNALADFTFKAACSAGARGPVHEARMYFNSFGYELSAIQQPVHYWWGTEDKAVARLHAEAVEQLVPRNTMHYYPGEGHLSVFLKYFEEALKEISRNAL